MYKNLCDDTFIKIREGVSQAFFVLGDRNSGKSTFTRGGPKEPGAILMFMEDLFSIFQLELETK